MKEIITLLNCIIPIIGKTKQNQLKIIIQALLSMRGRITMLGLSRWSEKGGSYRTIERFFNSKILGRDKLEIYKEAFEKGKISLSIRWR